MGLELYILDFIQNFRTPFLDSFMVFVTKLGDFGIIWILICLVLLAKKRTRKFGLYMLMTLFINFIITNIVLKPIVARPRPFSVRQLEVLLISLPRDYSFPSGHTSTGFSFFFGLVFARLNEYWLGKKLLGGYIASYIKFDRLFVFSLILAGLIAFSRLYLYVHYPSDIIGGIGVALISSYFSYKLAKIYYLR